ncbi:MAG: endonuclease/exonuclease/phosphatase family protein, partial [Beijerinckiaceae bacterium]
MRHVITDLVDALPLPSAEERHAADMGPSTQAENDRWMDGWRCMNALERVQPPSPAAAAADLRVAAWNIERCKHVEATADLLEARGVDLVLATEMDWGCARSGQRHTTAEVAAALGLGHVFGVEFVELALGDTRETAEHAGETNLHGLHGNAVLSRHPIGRAALIPLDDGGQWYVSDMKQGQRRIGGRNAIAAEILLPQGAIWAVAVHFESESSPATRGEAARRLLAGLKPLVGDQPVVIGGDFNVFDLSRQGLDDAAMFARPGSVEPTFDVFADAGFDWRQSNAPGATIRRHPWQSQE